MCAAASVETRSLEREGWSNVDQAFATVVALLEAREEAPRSEASASSSEELLLDMELGGCRYLLLRMPVPQHTRIHLSPRESEIVRMVAKGHPNKVIADVLNISSWTVCTHLRRIFAKLGVGSRAAMVAQLLEIGALTSDNRGNYDVRSSRR